jgi:hypothetical protein
MRRRSAGSKRRDGHGNEKHVPGLRARDGACPGTAPGIRFFVPDARGANPVGRGTFRCMPLSGWATVNKYDKEVRQSYRRCRYCHALMADSETKSVHERFCEVHDGNLHWGGPRRPQPAGADRPGQPDRSVGQVPAIDIAAPDRCTIAEYRSPWSTEVISLKGLHDRACSSWQVYHRRARVSLVIRGDRSDIFSRSRLQALPGAPLSGIDRPSQLQ